MRVTGRGGRVLVAALVVDSTGTGLLLPLYLVYFLHLTDVPLGTLGVLATLANTVTLPLPMWVGTLADRYGSVALVVAAQVFQTVGYACFGVVDGPIGIFLALTLVTFGVRVFWGSVFSLLADYADSTGSHASKESWFSWATIARTAGLTVGGLIAGAAVADGRDLTYRAISYAAAACFLAAAVSIAVWVRAPVAGRIAVDTGAAAGDKGGYRGLVRDTTFLSFTAINVVFALSSLMLALALPTAVLVGLRGPSWLPTVALVGNAVLVTVGTRFLVRRLSGHRRTRTLAAAAILWAAWSVLLAVAPPAVPVWIIGIVVVSTLVFTVAEALHGPVSTALAGALAPIDSRGRYLAVFQYSFALAGVIGPVFFTQLFELHRTGPWIGLAAVNIVAAVSLVALEKRVPAHALTTSPERRPEESEHPVAA